MSRPWPWNPEVLTATGAHLPTLEAIRVVVQQRVDAAEAELSHKASVGVQSPYGEGYVYAMRHVLDLLQEVGK